jgi:hypothetical protein
MPEKGHRIKYRKYDLMKKLIIVFVAISLLAGAGSAIAQVKGDFSDWNVPPPVPPGTQPKQPNNKSNSPAVQQTDVPAPAQPVTGPVKLPELGPVITTYLTVTSPEQPAIDNPAAFNELMPLPAMPDGIDPPRQAPQDKATQGATDMPQPVAPESPPLPPMPVADGSSTNERSPKLPIVPMMESNASIGVVPGSQFPFTMWPVPGIPGNVQITRPSAAAATNQHKVKTVKKQHK